MGFVVDQTPATDGLEPTPAQLAGARCTACARAQARCLGRDLDLRVVR